MELVRTKNDTARMTLRLDAKLMARLNEYHKATEIPKARIINKALQNYLDELEEDLADAEIAAAAWREFEASGEKAIPADEARKMCGL